MGGPGRYFRLLGAFGRLALATEMSFRTNFLVKLVVEALWLAILVLFYELIFRNELMLNRPVAARAALERAAHFQPGDQEAREQFEALFGSQSRLPACARKRYAFRPTPASRHPQCQANC